MESDPGLRKKISLYHSNDRDKVHRAYWLKGPTQPKIKIFLKTFFRHNFKLRKFNQSWYSEPNSYWLEYSEAKDAVYVFVAIFLGQFMENKPVEILLLMKDLEIGRRNISWLNM